MEKPTRSDALADLVSVSQPKLMVEFGSWEGASAIVFLKAARKMSLDLKLICVDTWLGSKEHWENTFPNSQWSFERLAVVDGEPTVFRTFKKRLKDQEMLSRVSIVRAHTSHATAYIAASFPPIDLAYVDADHAYKAVVADLRLVKSLVTKNGVIAGDDWAWFSVRRAVASFSVGRRRILNSPDRSTYVVIGRKQKAVANKFMSLGWRSKSPVFLLTLGWVRPLLRKLSKSSKHFLDLSYLRMYKANSR